MTPQGLVLNHSPHPPQATVDRLAAEIAAHGMTIMARIDHAAAAHEVGLVLRPTQLILFGNPRAGTLLMQQTQSIGIDLPLRMLVWQDDKQQTWLAYNDPQMAAARHAVTCGTVVEAMSHALAEIARKTIAQD
jgi:uncharacterized protein (DUF302 family)